MQRVFQYRHGGVSLYGNFYSAYRWIACEKWESGGLRFYPLHHSVTWTDHAADYGDVLLGRYWQAADDIGGSDGSALLGRIKTPGMRQEEASGLFHLFT